MKTKLFNRDYIESNVYLEKANTLKMYVCSYCKKVDLYIITVDGMKTPDAIVCDCCGNSAYESAEPIIQPTRIWYRPDDEAALEVLAENATKILRKEYSKQFNHISDEKLTANILDEYIRHYNHGGLFAKNLNEENTNDDT